MSCIKGISVYFPKNILTNDQISEQFPEWNSQKILEKIGVKQRYISSSDEFSSDLASKAVLKLLEEQHLSPNEIDFLIVCTQSPDFILPTTACIVQQKAGLPTSCAAIDINQGCSGYVYGLSLADGLVSSGKFKNVVLVTADTYSKYIHPTDKGNLSIFGDAATATLISNEGNYRIGDFTLGTDGQGQENLIIKNSGVRFRACDLQNMDNFLHMKGNKIFNFIVKQIPSMLHENLEANNLKINEVDLFVFHQANTFILERVRQEMNIPPEKFVLEMLNCGNTVSSTIPIALKEHLRKNPQENYQTIQLAGFGVGYSWGSVCLFRK